jgi:hypothetical protein
MILISVILLSVVHPGPYASATQDGGTHVYKPKAHSTDTEYGYELCTDEQRLRF